MTESVLDRAKNHFERKGIEFSENDSSVIENALAGLQTVLEGTDDKTLHAETINFLCTDKVAKEHVTHKGLYISHAIINGKIELEFVGIPFPLGIVNSIIFEKILLRDSSIPLLALNGSRTKGLDAGGVKFKGSVLLDECFYSEGEVRFLESTIGGQLSCKNSIFENIDGYALSADGLEVKGSVFLTNGFISRGEVRFLGAIIGCNLECDNSILSNSNSYAFNADNIVVKGSVFLRNIILLEGKVNLINASINGWLIFKDFIQDSEIEVELQSFKAGTIWINSASLSKKSKIWLNNFKYDNIHEDDNVTTEDRLAWLALQPKDQFTPQPYEQLAKVLKRDGHDEDATEILVAKARLYGKHIELSWFQQKIHKLCSPVLNMLGSDISILYKKTNDSSAKQIEESDSFSRHINLTLMQWLFHIVSGFLIDYGYRPLKALKIALYAILVFSFMYGYAFTSNCMDRTRNQLGINILVPDYSPELPGYLANLERKAYSVIYTIAYSADVFVPLVDLEVAKYWIPDTNTHVGFIVMIGLWVQIIFGWLLTTFFVAGISRVIRI